MCDVTHQFDAASQATRIGCVYIQDDDTWVALHDGFGQGFQTIYLSRDTCVFIAQPDS